MSLAARIIESLPTTERSSVQRNEWKFDHTATRLAEAAQTKIAHHTARLEFWRGKREKTVACLASHVDWHQALTFAQDVRGHHKL